MSISSASVLKDGTVATTGGTATSMITLDKGNGHKVLIDDGAAFNLQSTIDFSVKSPKVSSSAPGGYTQGRNSVYLRVPLSLDNGNRTVNTAQISISCDPETTDAERLTMRVYLAQLLVDSDFTVFWDDQGIE